MSFAIFVQKCVLYCLVIFYTSLATIHILITFLKNPRKFVTQKDRTRQPEVLKKGWNHAFVSLSVSFEQNYVNPSIENFFSFKKIKIHYVHDGNPDGPLMLFVHGFPEFWYSWRHQLKEFKKDYQ